jgi:glycerol-3-phosphate dehydrogenase
LHGAALANQCAVTRLAREGARVTGVHVTDLETGLAFTVRAHCVINATGVFADQLLQDGASSIRPALVTPSQGVHLSFDSAFLPGTSAVFWPKTSDSRVLFAIPWLGKTIVGTTDTKRSDAPAEPRPLPGEIDYLLRECAQFFSSPPRRADVLSAWVGLRPLVNANAGDDRATKSISREHSVLVRQDGLVTVTGEKWTTYRSMAQDVLDQCEAATLFPARSACATARTRLLGSDLAQPTVGLTGAAGLHSYGSEAAQVGALPGSNRFVAPHLTEAMVRFAVRREFARTVEDVLARRSRLLFLDARAALASTDAVADIMETETLAPSFRDSFRTLATKYIDLGR